MNTLLTKLLKGSANDLASNISNIVDNFVTSDADKLKAKKEITNVVLTNLTEIADYQKEVLVTELQGNKLQRNWRPIVMLMFAFIVVYSKFIAPAFSLPNTNLESDFWELLRLGIGGYVIGRSAEKISKIVTKNTDLTFIKKKKRTL